MSKYINYEKIIYYQIKIFLISQLNNIVFVLLQITLHRLLLKNKNYNIFAVLIIT